MMNPNDIEEGDDVFFYCKVYANPRAYKIVWKHNVSHVILIENSLMVVKFIFILFVTRFVM